MIQYKIELTQTDGRKVIYCHGDLEDARYYSDKSKAEIDFVNINRTLIKNGEYEEVRLLKREVSDWN